VVDLSSFRQAIIFVTAKSATFFVHRLCGWLSNAEKCRLGAWQMHAFSRVFAVWHLEGIHPFGQAFIHSFIFTTFILSGRDGILLV